MVFSLRAVNELKASASKVLEAIIENRNLREVQNAFSELSELWDSPSVVLFRRAYGSAAVSIQGFEHLKNWGDVIQGMNSAEINVRFIKYKPNTDRLLGSMSGFYTGLSVMESAHIDDINDFYVNK